MSIRNLARAATTLMAMAVATIVTMAIAPAAHAHGYSTSPTSRALYCHQGTVTDCGQIQWEPQSVEGPKGFPSAGPVDGTLCAGGNARFAELDDPRNGNWPTNSVSSGQNYQFSWHIAVSHSTTDFKYYLTKPGWDPTQVLTRDSLDLTPFLTVPFGGSRPGSEVHHTGVLPDRTGHHLLFAVWTVDDTGNAFYQCSDLDFG